jgi:hypothetical protein
MTPESRKVFLAPFKDRRRNRSIYRGRAEYEHVTIDAFARTTLAKAWQKLPKGDLSYLWHRQLALELASAGYDVSAAAEPMDDASAMAAAKEAGAEFLMQGELKKMGIAKRGADTIFGTNFSGTNYMFYSENRVFLKSTADSKKLPKRDLEFERVFYNKESFGAADRDTFPHYFARALPEAGRHLADDSVIREAVGMPTCTPTPTATITPEPEKKGSPELTPRIIVATPTVVPEDEPYWYNPNTGKRVNPAWNFDPEDGTPKSKFILRRRQ